MMERQTDHTGELCRLTDAELVGACLDGRRGAMGELYRRYSGAMFEVCRRITGDSELARDVVHDGFIIVFSRLDSLRRTDRLYGWMARIMANLALKQVADAGRRRRAEAAVAVGQGGDSTAADVPLDVLLAMVDRLPRAYGLVFRLAMLDGLGHDEISRLVGIKPKSSASNLARARAMLRLMVDRWRREAGLAVVALLAVVSALLHRDISRRPAGFAGVRVARHSWAVASQPPGGCGARVGQGAPCRGAVGRHSRSPQPSAQVVAVGLRPLAPAPISAAGPPIDAPRPLEPRPVQPPQPAVGHAAPRRTALSLGGSAAAMATRLLASAAGMGTETGIGSATRDALSTWEGLNHFVTYTPPEGMDPLEREALMHISMMNSGTIITRRTYSRPVAVGLAASWQLSGRWALETGLRLTLMRSEAVTGSSDTTNITRRDKALYIGVPLNATYTIAGSGPLRFYATAGVAVDVPVWHTSAVDYNIDNRLFFTRHDAPGRPAVQLSVGAGVGVGYEIAPRVELFFAPRATYYLPSGGTPTLWQQQRLQLSWPVGIRLKY